jgi:hypothetical protein
MNFTKTSYLRQIIEFIKIKMLIHVIIKFLKFTPISRMLIQFTRIGGGKVWLQNYALFEVEIQFCQINQ